MRYIYIRVFLLVDTYVNIFIFQLINFCIMNSGAYETFVAVDSCDKSFFQYIPRNLAAIRVEISLDA